MKNEVGKFYEEQFTMTHQLNQQKNIHLNDVDDDFITN